MVDGDVIRPADAVVDVGAAVLGVAVLLVVVLLPDAVDVIVDVAGADAADR